MTLRIPSNSILARVVLKLKATSFRFLNGLRGTYEDWDWDTGLLI